MHLYMETLQMITCHVYFGADKSVPFMRFLQKIINYAVSTGHNSWTVSMQQLVMKAETLGLKGLLKRLSTGCLLTLGSL